MLWRNRWLQPFFDEDGKGGGDGGAVVPEWAKDLPEDLRSNPIVGKTPDIQTLVKNAIEMEKYRGSSIKIPGEDATPEDLRKFYTRLGVPEKVEGYEVSTPEGVEMGDREKAILDRFKGIAHANGITPKAFQGLVNDYFEQEALDMKAFEEANDKAIQECVSKLHEKWGSDFDKNADMALKAVEAWGLSEVLDAKGLSNSVELSEFFLEIGKSMAEGKIKGGVNAFSGDDPEAELKRLMADEEFLKELNHKDSRVRKKAVERRNALYQAIARNEASRS